VWNRRKEEELFKPSVPPAPPAAAPPPPPIEPIKKETKPVSSTPVGRFEPESRGGPTHIGKAVKIVGNMFSKEDLYVDGEVEGSIEALENKLTIGPNGSVKAGIKVREVVAIGSIHGNVEASEKLEIRKEAKLVGDIKTARIIIEDGAYFKGSIDIVKPEPPRPPQRPALVSQPAPPAQQAIPIVSDKL
jgi:cytoskeletal protein CcmA (bactofilin family)